VPYSFGILHLAPLWSTFLSENPQVQLDIVLSDRMVDLVEEGYDMAVRIGVLTDSALISRRLATTRLILCATPTYLERHGTPKVLKDLAHHQAIVYSYSARAGEWSVEGRAGRQESQGQGEQRLPVFAARLRLRRRHRIQYRLGPRGAIGHLGGGGAVRRTAPGHHRPDRQAASRGGHRRARPE